MNDINIDLSIIKQEPLEENSDDAMPIDTFVTSKEIEDDAMHIDTLSEPNIKQEPFNEDSQNFVSSVDAKPINTFVSSDENVKPEIKKEPVDSESSEDYELKEIQRERNKQKMIKNNLISKNYSIFLYAKSCPNCKKSFNSSIIKKKVMHFKSCCNSKKRWVEERELNIMVEDLKYKFKTAMEKHKHEHIDYDGFYEVTNDMDTKKIYEYFSIEKLNKRDKKENKVNNMEDFQEYDHKKEIGDDDQSRS
ncbi:hypothetical protein GLOIN_2v1497258 [Rhizophagus clarus]|uniref:Uncharacterized protein n=1 Tax=Rhizophagus clarus TaxID=94130 RepID=A0A8H3QCA4_9GLOM|nr:hypothetical protein GLOIN_2v1497258 [Rhizophagus clarus]